MTRQQLTEQIRAKGSYLCVGLDSDIAKIPRHLLTHADPVFEFNRQIIDATAAFCVSYKINTAFYESSGAKGWDTMERTVNYIPSTHFKIADAKRGDIGNTSAHYAKAFFETLAFDAITAAPYMGEDSIKPFLEFKDKWTILLGLTSNPGAADFELQRMSVGESHRVGDKNDSGDQAEYLYEKVLRTASGWGTPDNLMFVIGATQSDWFEGIRRLTPDHFYLVPGVGSQEGSLREVSAKAMNKDVGLLVNVSRGIIYISESEDFAVRAGDKAGKYRKEMGNHLAPLRKS
jgi:orotidine-5'-phosphate decarboxylase